VSAVRIGRRCRPRHIAGDKGYSYPRIRRWLRWHGIKAVIPQRSNQLAQHRGRPLNFDKGLYRRRNVIECCMGWLKECRRVGTRFEKLALNFVAMIKLAIIRRYFRILDLSDGT
jgi:transposase